MGSRQHTDFRHDLPNGLHVAAIDAFAGVENVPANDLGFEFFEDGRDRELVVFRFAAFWEEVVITFFLTAATASCRSCLPTIE